jgi:hypothetical protein
MLMERAIHPVAEIFPMMSPAELKVLAEDIQANGLIEPIVLHEDRVLDGRNRLIACGLVGVEPRFEDAGLNGGSPTLFVVSKNLHRRHLSQSQRAAISTTLRPMLQEEARQRLQEGRKSGGQTAGSGRPKNSSPSTLKESYLGLFLKTYGGNIDRAALVKKLAKYPGGSSGLIGDARGLRQFRHASIVRCVAEQTVEVYNSGRRGGKLDPL